MYRTYSPEAAKQADKRYEEMCDLATEIAKQTETRQGILDMIRYPTWATPPQDERGQYMDWAADMRSQAAKIIREREKEREEKKDLPPAPVEKNPHPAPGLLNRRPIIVDKNRESLYRLRDFFPKESTGMAKKRRTTLRSAPVAAALLATTAVLCTGIGTGCLPAKKQQAAAPVVDEQAYWRAKYKRNRMVPPEQYSLLPAPPRNNDFGEFNDGMYTGLDRQPALPPLPDDGWDGMGMMMRGGSGEYAGVRTTRAPAGPAFAPARQSRGAESAAHFYPVEQLVYGGDYGELDNPEEYRLMPRDEISVTVRDHPEFSGKLSIQPDGTIRIPNTPDPVHLRGRTTDEAADEIRKGIAVYVKGECAVRVQANRARGGYYFVFGDVKQPGRFPMGMEPVKLSDAVMAANFEANPNRLDEDEELGPAFPAASPRGAFVAPGTADMARVMLITPHRSQPARTTHDLRQAMLGMTAGDPLVRPGQIIVVPSLDPKKNVSIGLDMPNRPIPPAPVLRPGQGFSTADSPARLPEILPYADDFSEARAAAPVSGLESNLANAYAVQSNEEATRINEFPVAEEVYEEEVYYEEPAIPVESVPMPTRGRRLKKAPFAETFERAADPESADGWKKGF